MNPDGKPDAHTSEPDGPAPVLAAPEAPRDNAPRAEGSLVRNAGVVAAGTLVSRVLGLVRDQVIAAHFPRELTDPFFTAFTIPNALRALLAEGAVSAAVIPLYSEARAKEGEGRAKEVHRTLAGALLLVLAAVSVLGVVFAPLIVGLYASGYADDPVLFARTVLLVRIMFPYIFFMGSAAVGMAALNANGRFAVASLTPALLNVALIAAPFALVPLLSPLGVEPIVSLAIAVVIGGLLQVVAQWPALRAIDHLRPPRLSLRDPMVKRAALLLVPVTVGLGVYQLNVMLSQTFASFLGEGSRSYLYYGQRLVEIPQGMFALALASASLPRLSALRNAGDVEGVRVTLMTGVRQALFIALPASVLLVVLAEPLIAVLFGRGAFLRVDVLETSRSLAWQGAGVVFIALVRVLVPVFHAHGDTKSPVWASAGNLIAFAAVTGLLLRLGHVGIAIGITAAGAVQLVLLSLLVRRKLGRVLPSSLVPSQLVLAVLRLVFASGAAGGAAYGVALFGHWERGGNDLGNLVVLIVAMLAAGLAYVLGCWLVGASELRDVMGALRRRTGSAR